MEYLGKYYDEENWNTSTNQALAYDVQETNACSQEQHLENGLNENKSLLYNFPLKKLTSIDISVSGMAMALF